MNWEGADEEGKARTVYSEVIPKVKVTGTEVDFENVYVGEQREVLEMKKLSEWTGTELRERLKDFIFKYKKWIEEREREIESIVWENKYFSEQAKRNMEECRKLFIRMQKGTEALSCGRVLKAFRDANKAMYLQWDTLPGKGEVKIVSISIVRQKQPMPIVSVVFSGMLRHNWLQPGDLFSWLFCYPRLRRLFILNPMKEIWWI